MNDRCAICGARLGENNTTGIGFECQAALDKAKENAFFKNEDYAFRYNYLIEANAVHELFVSLFADTKFRSEFNRSFYESMKNASHVSRKQLNIMRSKIECKDCDTFYKMNTSIYQARKQFINSTCKNITVTREEIEVARRQLKYKSATREQVKD